MEPPNLTATEVQELWDKWWKKWQEAEARLIEPILDRMLEIMRRNGQ